MAIISVEDLRHVPGPDAGGWLQEKAGNEFVVYWRTPENRPSRMRLSHAGGKRNPAVATLRIRRHDFHRVVSIARHRSSGGRKKTVG
jgi:hypothetical protein